MHHFDHSATSQSDRLLANGRILDRASLRKYRLQYPPTVAESAKVAGPVDARVLEARDLGDDEAGFRDPNVYKRLNLKAVTPEPPVAVCGRGRCGV